MAKTIMQRDKEHATWLGTKAAISGGLGLGLMFLLPTPVGIPLGIVGLGYGAYSAYRWFMFRARRGMRF